MIRVNADMSKGYPKITKTRPYRVSSDILPSVFSETFGVSENAILILANCLNVVGWKKGIKDLVSMLGAG